MRAHFLQILPDKTRTFIQSKDQKEHGPDMKGQLSSDLYVLQIYEKAITIIEIYWPGQIHDIYTIYYIYYILYYIV